MAEWVKAGLVGLVFAMAGVLAPEWWLPWVLVFAGALLAWTATEWTYTAAARSTRASVARIVKALTKGLRTAIVAALVIAIIVATRFLLYGTVALQTASLDPAFPGDDVRLSGS